FCEATVRTTCVYTLNHEKWCGKAFFFSSRRRHTRSKRDWSSDVCSSDLIRAVTGFVAENLPAIVSAGVSITGSIIKGIISNIPRSEERRVGKERKYKRWADH